MDPEKKITPIKVKKYMIRFALSDKAVFKPTNSKKTNVKIVE